MLSEDDGRERRIAVILAGGTGSRVGLETPKQLVRVAGRTILEHTVSVFEQSAEIDEIMILMAPGYLDAVRAMVRSAGFGKVSAILEGRGTRNDTTRAALDQVAARAAPGDPLLVIHDAVRPLLTEEIIAANIKALESFDAVDTVIESADTIIRVTPGGDTIDDVLERALLRRGQTPQSFRFSVLRRAYDLAAEDSDFVATDDCTVVLRYLPDVRIAVVPGHETNLKVTYPIDMYLADRLFQLGATTAPHAAAEELRAGLEGRTVVVFGGGYGIGRSIADLATEAGARVLTLSRSLTGTHVEQRASVREAADRARRELGTIDMVVNTAGVLPRGELVHASEEDVFHATEVNYLAPVWIAQEFQADLAETRGSLLLFTSSSYTRGRAGYALYSSAKAAVVNLTQALADEWAEAGIRVNCVNPERTATPMRSRAFGDEPPESLLSPTSVATTALEVLVSRLTGHVIDVRSHERGATLG